MKSSNQTTARYKKGKGINMNGAREYGRLFNNGDTVIGKLTINTGCHARGQWLHIYVNDGENRVEVYGITGGHPGWTETYGWLREGPWQEDFRNIVEELTKKKIQMKLEYQQRERQQKEAAEAKAQGILSSY